MADSTRDKDGQDAQSRQLRKRAEEKVKERFADFKKAAKADADAMLHELQVHRIELEMQNDELRAAQQQLFQSRQKYVELFQSAPVGYLVLDGEARITEFNRMAAGLLGRPLETPGKYPLGLCIDQSDLAVFTAHKKTVLAEGLRDECDVHVLKADGRQGYVHLISEPVKDDGGKISGCRTSIIDIAELKRIDEAAMQRQAELTEAQRLTHIGSWYWDAATDVTTGSDELLRIYGFDPAKESMPDFKQQRGLCYPEEDWDKVNAAVQKALQTGIGYELDVRALCRGVPIWITTRSETVRDAGGRVVALRGTVQDITERRQTQEALRQANELLEQRVAQRTQSLRESEEEYRRLFEYSGAANAEVDVATCRFLRVNKRLCEMSGYSEEELVGMSFPELAHPDDRESDKKKFAGAIRTGKPYDSEKRYICKDGSVKWVHVVSSIVYDEEGRPVKSIGSIIDITERRKAAEAAKAALSRYKSFMEVTGQLGWTTDAKGEVVEDIPLWRRFTGQSFEEVKGWGWAKALHPDDVEHASEVWRIAVRDATKYKCEYRVRRHDGVYRHFEVRGVPIFNDDRSVREWVGTCIDITEHREREEKLDRLNRTLTALSKSNQAVSHARDEKDYVAAVCRIIVEDCGHKLVWIGYAEDDEAKTIRPVAYSGFEEGYLETLKLTWADTERGRGPTGMAIRTGKASLCRNILTDPRFKPWRKEAIKRGYASSIVFPLMESDKVFGSLSIYSKEPDAFTEDEVKLLTELANDLAFGITTLRLRAMQAKAEDALRQSELRERQRSADLERLSDELEYKNEELESIIRIASHDLRSPLMNIKGFSGELAKDIGKLAEMLKKAHLPPEIGAEAEKIFGKYVPEAVGFIQASADSITGMIKSLMDVAKAGTVAINIRNIDMDALLAKIAAHAKLKIKECGGELAVEKVPPCRGDAEQLAQVFTNIIENAIKYRDQQRPLQIRIYAATDEGMVTYCVEDNGKGIAEDHLQKVFDLFTRLDREAAAGEGIGLTTAKRMVERQGGRIWASSQVGKGSKFFISLPR